jgi:hypothetical protein
VSKFCGAHRAPRTALDPIVDASQALDVVQLAMSSPQREEIVVLVLDADHRGRAVVVVDGTEDDDAVVEVVERLAEPVRDGPDRARALVVASIRLGRGPVAADADRWLEASELADDAGVELLEWFVVQAEGDTIVASCPRDLLAEPPRWRSG